MPESSYSPGLRTAVVLCGAGTAGVYQAGVLRALAEAGVKVDLFAAHGAGVITALCGAIDGGARLWDPAGPWLSPRLRRAYRWRAALRAGALGLAAAGLLVISPVAILGFAAMLYTLGLMTALVNLPNVSLWLIELYQRSLGVLFHRPILPTMLPRAVVLALLVVIGVLAPPRCRRPGQSHAPALAGGFWWRLVDRLSRPTRSRPRW